MSLESLFWAALLLVSATLSALMRKVAANNLTSQAAPVFIFVWLLFGFIITIPLFQEEWRVTLESISQNTWLVLPIIFKGALVYYASCVGMKLTKKSLSVGNFILPTALNFSPFMLAFMGEEISLYQILICVSLGAVGFSFFLFGHISELGISARKKFMFLVVLSLGMIAADYIVIGYSNWMLLLFGSTITQLVFIIIHKTPWKVWEQALFTKAGILAGSSFALFEFIGFYQMGTITPISITVAIKAAAIPFVQLAASIIWHERGWREQLMWGVVTMAMLVALAFG